MPARPSLRSLNTAAVAVGIWVAAGSTAGVEVASTVEAGEVSAAAVAGFAGDRMLLLLPATAVRVPQRRILRARAGSMLHDPATATLGPAVISRAGINGMEIRPRRLLLPLMDNGIHLRAHPAAVDLRARNRKLVLQTTRADST